MSEKFRMHEKFVNRGIKVSSVFGVNCYCVFALAEKLGTVRSSKYRIRKTHPPTP